MPDRKGKIFYTSITSLSHISKIGWHVAGFTYSPIKGPKGNIEFLADIRPGAGDMPDDAQIAALVREAHETLDK